MLEARCSPLSVVSVLLALTQGFVYVNTHTHTDTCTGSFLFSLGLREYKYLHTNMPSQKLAPGSQETPGPSLHMSEHSKVLTGK